MEMLVRAGGATSAVETGTFTGYSALAVPRGLALWPHRPLSLLVRHMRVIAWFRDCLNAPHTVQGSIPVKGANN